MEGEALVPAERGDETNRKAITSGREPMETDWRLRGQEKYLQGKTLFWKAWSQSRPNWDHDHCEFCWARFCDDGCGNGLAHGYTDETEYRWICKPCFDDFRERFAWKVGAVGFGLRTAMLWRRIAWRLKYWRKQQKGAGLHGEVGGRHSLVETEDKKESEQLSGEGFDLHAAGRLDEAVLACREAIRLNPDNDAAYSNLAAALNEKNKLPEALLAVQRAIQLDPTQHISVNLLGLVLSSMGKFEEAVVAHERALALEPRYANGYFCLAIALVDAGRIQEAATTCEAAAKLMTKNPKVYGELAYIYEQMKKPAEQETALRKGVQATGDHRLRYFLGRLLAELRRLGEAAEVLRSLVEDAPSYVESHIELGYVLAEMGDLEAAIPEYEQALKLDPSQEQAKWNLFVVKERLRKRMESRQDSGS